MQHIYNGKLVARNAYDIANVVLNIIVVQRQRGAVFRVFGSQPRRPWIETTLCYLAHVV